MQNTVSSLKKRADKLISILVRKGSSDFSGYCRCYTCGKVNKWERMQCGHFVGRSNNILRYDLRNLRVQCEACNIWKHGNLYEYGKRLDEECGYGTADSLISEGREKKQFTVSELKELCEKFNKLIKDL